MDGGDEELQSEANQYWPHLLVKSQHRKQKEIMFLKISGMLVLTDKINSVVMMVECDKLVHSEKNQR